jgi:NADPH:quinone reductase-like Zn-dependent oxidoreductase
LIVLALSFLSRKGPRLARARGARYEYLFMRADGVQLAHIGELLESKVIRPVVDRIFPLAEAKEALAYVESGRAVGKVVVDLMM